MSDPKIMPFSMENQAARAWARRIIDEVEQREGIGLSRQTCGGIYETCIEALKWMDQTNEDLRRRLVDALRYNPTPRFVSANVKETE